MRELLTPAVSSSCLIKFEITKRYCHLFYPLASRIRSCQRGARPLETAEGGVVHDQGEGRADPGGGGGESQ